MKGDFSRKTFNRKKHYAAVLMQQGRVQTDADFNEAQAIQQHRHHTTAGDVIGLCGTPKDSPGFEISFAADGGLAVDAGRYYVDGILCENEAAVKLAEQIAGVALPTAAQTLQEASATIGLVYLDAWARYITPIDDPLIRETALGGPDTAGRSQIFWLAKVLPLRKALTGAVGLADLIRQQRELRTALAGATAPAERARLRIEVDTNQREIAKLARAAGVFCTDDLDEWRALTASPAARMDARTQPGETSTDPCAPASTGAGFSRLENQLYRVEVHQGGPVGTATFKWSRENGSIVAQITAQDPAAAILTVDSTGRDDYLAFQNGGVAEFTDDRIELTGAQGQLVRVQDVKSDRQTIELDVQISGLNTALHPKLRRWDHTPDTGGAVRITGDWQNLEDGVQVRFSGSNFVTGQYWLIPARTGTGQIEWPEGGPQPPKGINHHYCPLALVMLDGSNVAILADCRSFFPALTRISASDVRFDNDACKLPGAETVQEAIDALCQRNAGPCTINLSPGQGWEAALTAIGANEDATICFGIGDFTLSQPVTISGAGNLKVTGAGGGTRIIALAAEAALVFQNCRSVIVRDLHAEARAAGTSDSRKNLNGPLTFRGCPSVTVESSSFRCAAGTARSATCLTIANEGASVAGSVARVRGCTFAVGEGQTGLLLVNVDRSQIEDNTLNVVDSPAPANPRDKLKDSLYRGLLRKRLVSDLKLVKAGAAAPADPLETRLMVGRFAVSFKTDPALKDTWAVILREQPPGLVETEKDATSYIRLIAERFLKAEEATAGEVIRNPEVLRIWNLFLARKLREDRSVASQGIVIGGTVARDVRIVNNTVRGALQGIHIGTSRREGAPGAPVLANVVIIANNTVEVLLPASATRERHGIFAGNADSLIIENNFLSLQRIEEATRLLIDGIRVYGHAGRRMIVRHNHAAGFSRGVLVNLLSRLTGAQWLVADNLGTVSATSAVAGQIRVEGNRV